VQIFLLFKERFAKTLRRRRYYRESAKDYLEKVIQLRFDLPPIVERRWKIILRSQKIVDKDMLSRWRALIAAGGSQPAPREERHQ